MTFRKVLIVEDEQLLGENLKAYLETRGCEVRLAQSGRQAIRLVAAFGPDILLLDYRLPDMAGLQVLEALRGWHEGECVLMTAHPLAEVCDGAARLGITHILLKPFPLAELGRVVCKPEVGAAGVYGQQERAAPAGARPGEGGNAVGRGGPPEHRRPDRPVKDGGGS